MRVGRVILAAFASGVMSACAPQGSPAGYRALGPSAEPLRTAFNANVGKVRVIMLVAPT
jgi:hypothetical protein